MLYLEFLLYSQKTNICRQITCSESVYTQILFLSKWSVSSLFCKHLEHCLPVYTPSKQRTINVVALNLQKKNNQRCNKCCWCDNVPNCLEPVDCVVYLYINNVWRLIINSEWTTHWRRIHAEIYTSTISSI